MISNKKAIHVEKNGHLEMLCQKSLVLFAFRNELNSILNFVIHILLLSRSLDVLGCSVFVPVPPNPTSLVAAADALEVTGLCVFADG